VFTGLVDAIGVVRSRRQWGPVVALGISSPYAAESIPIGASISCAGVCLTVVRREPDPAGSVFTVQAAPETLDVTTVGGWDVGTKVNLERPLKAGDELGGHIVQGHVDGVARITERKDIGDATLFRFEAPAALARFIAAKGSVALDGTSLTVNHVDGAAFDCLLIPHTLAVTTWADRRAGDSVNLEVDLLARYLARLAETA
jgi:riboflavin synthase